LISAVIVAGGKGKRMGSALPKQFLKINGVEILALTIEKFEKCSIVDEILVVVSNDEIDYCRSNIIDRYNFTKVKKVVNGGKERFNSVYNGLKNCSKETDIVIIHDGVRPFVTQDMIKNSAECAKKYGACAAGVAIKDTIKLKDRENYIEKTINRDELIAIQTPQAFDYNLILKAYNNSIEKGIFSTDDTMLIEALHKKVRIIDGSYLNIKITTPEDLIFAESIVNNWEE
jgi:2-C-methyl-D-erythritol 4-phosphate cytidylyltransferase